MPATRRPRHSGDEAIPLIQIDRAVFRVCPPDFELLLYTHRPNRSLIDAVAGGPVELALVVEEPAILILARFGADLPWTVASYEGAPEMRGRRLEPEGTALGPERRSHLDVILLDAGCDAILATRAVPLWVDFTRRLDALLRDQARLRFDPIEFRRAVARLHGRFPTPAILAAHAEIRCPLPEGESGDSGLRDAVSDLRAC